MLGLESLLMSTLKACSCQPWLSACSCTLFDAIAVCLQTAILAPVQIIQLLPLPNSYVQAAFLMSLLPFCKHLSTSAGQCNF